MGSMKKQQGMTAVGWLFVLLIIAMFSIFALKLIPMYIDSFTVTSSLESLKTDPKARGKSGREIRQLLMRRLDINMVRDVTASDVSVTRSRDGVIVEIDYEAREPLFDDLYIVLSYNKSVVIPR